MHLHLYCLLRIRESVRQARVFIDARALGQTAGVFLVVNGGQRSRAFEQGAYG
jgi:hypothetical protein